MMAADAGQGRLSRAWNPSIERQWGLGGWFKEASTLGGPEGKLFSDIPGK